MTATDLVAGYDLHTDAGELGAATTEIAADTFTLITYPCCPFPSFTAAGILDGH
ncbi:hypothetical protein GCM10029978_021160 [Actinoallomurus acanthiterrae]